MKNKKHFSMAELCSVNATKTKYLVFLFLILLGIGLNSCKKDLFVGKTVPIDTAKDKIKTISYTEFLNSINLNNTASLKTTLSNAANKNQGAVMNISSGSNGFNINTDSIKKLTLGDTISYVISLKPETKHAVQFRNLTIQVLNDKTTAFLTTYLPTKEWVKDWKNNKHLGFKGQIFANKIALSDLPKVNGLNNSSQISKGKTMSLDNAMSEILINNNKISLAPGECEVYDIYVVAPRPCSTGDMPGSCKWEKGGLTLADVQAINGPGAHLPYFTLEISTVVNCAAPEFIPPPTGGGAGGSTTPNPPGGYDPCECDVPISVSNTGGKNEGLKLAVAAPNCCDTDNGGLYPIVIPFNENDPIILPADWDIEYPQEWYDDESQLDAVALLFAQHNAPPFSMIPEMYYINGVMVDMLNAPVKNGKTVFNVPRNHQFFWKEVMSKKTQMFSEFNRGELKAGRVPKVDEQWIKYNPTHKNYLNEPLHHHHEGQGRYAYAIPRKVHQKWTSILHQ